MADGKLGYGTKFQTGNGSSPESFTDTAFVTSITPPGLSRDSIDVSHMQSPDEWREFIALHDAYLAAVNAGGADLRRLAFPHAWSTGNRMAAWLWNARDEYAISHAVSRWLLDEALAVGDTEAIELGHRNCALEIPTRLGRIKVS